MAKSKKYKNKKARELIREPQQITEKEFLKLPLWAQVCVWIETHLTVEMGALIGEPFKLQPFQIEYIKALVSGKYKKIALTIARANGKTTLLAAIACAYLCGPLAIKNSRIPVVAVNKEQARITVETSWLFLKPFVCAEPDRWKFNSNEFEAAIIDRWNNITLEAVSADPRSKHGGAAPLSICDEPSQWMPIAGKKVINALTTAAGKQTNSVVAMIGTRPEEDSHFFAKTLKIGLNKKLRKETGIWAAQYAAPVDADYDDVDAIRLANPMWDFMPHLRKAILQEIEGVRSGEEDESVFRALRMNQGCPEISDREYILGPKSADVIKTCFVDVLPPREGPLFIGFDIGQARSLCGATLYFPDTGRCELYSGVPVGDVSLEERGREDGSPGIYEAAVKNGELWTFAGETTPVRAFLEKVMVALDGYVPEKIMADRYKQAEVKQAIKDLALNWGRKMDFRGAGRGKDGHSDIMGFCKEVYDAKVKMKPSILMVSAIQNATILRDNNQNASLDKSKSRARIDILQSAVMAINAGHQSRLPDAEDKKDRTFWGF